MVTLTARPQMLRASLATSDRSIGVDRENNILRGYVAAELGIFKTERGQFSSESLDKIVTLASETPKGLRSRFQQPNASDDGLGKYLGRSRNFRRDGDKVRADLHLDGTSLKTPPGGGKPLGEYVMDLASNDPEALGASLVLVAEKVPQPNGEPDVWLPISLKASDIVDEGDATHGGLLSAGGIRSLLDASPDWLSSAASPYLDQCFAGASRDVVEGRIRGFFETYLSRRFGAKSIMPEKPQSRMTTSQVAELNAATDRRIEDMKSQAQASIVAIDAEIQLHRRRSAITALCMMAGAPERAERYVRGDLLSVAEVRRMLFDEVLSVRNAPASDDPAGESRESSRDPDAELRAEFHAHRVIHERRGIDEGRYIESRRKEIEKAKKA